MNREQMKAALRAANITTQSDTAVSIGRIAASSLTWLESKADATIDGTKGAADGFMTGFLYQRGLDDGSIVE